jgi:hypothetical protein
MPPPRKGGGKKKSARKKAAAIDPDDPLVAKHTVCLLSALILISARG